MEHNDEVKLYCATQYLNHIKELGRKIKQLDEEIAHHRALVELSGVDYSEGVSGSSGKDQLESGVIKLQELIEESVNKRAEYVEQQIIANHVLSKLRPDHARALRAYYLKDKVWKEVCADMSYSWQGMMSLRRRAIIETYDYMPEEWRRYSIPNAQVHT